MLSLHNLYLFFTKYIINYVIFNAFLGFNKNLK